MVSGGMDAPVKNSYRVDPKNSYGVVATENEVSYLEDR